MGEKDSKVDQNDGYWKHSSTDAVIGILLFVLTFIVYLRFLAPTIFTGDSADATLASYALGMPHPPGFPVYTWIGHLFTLIPIGDIAYRVNLMSGFFGALVIPVAYAIIRSSAQKFEGRLSESASRFGAVVGSLALAFSITYWAQAEIAEVYTLNAFFVALMIFLSLTWAEKREPKHLYLLSIFFGLSLGIHASNILFAPCFLAFLYLSDGKALLDRRTLLTAIALSLAVGVIQIIYLYIRAMQVPAYIYMDIRSMDSFLSYITAKEYSAAPFSVSLSSGISMYVEFLAANFSLVGMALGVAGFALSLKRDLLRSGFYISLYAVNVLYFVRFESGDIADKLVPSFVIFSIFIGLGIWEILNMVLGPLANENDFKKLLAKDNLGKAILVVLVLIISAVVPVTSYTAYYQEIDQMRSTQLPFFLLDALKEVPANSTILDQWATCEPLKYYQVVNNVNPTVEIVGADPVDWTSRIDERVAKRNVFMVEIDEDVLKKYSEIPVLNMPGVGVLYKIYPGKMSFSLENLTMINPINESFDGKVKLLGCNLLQKTGERGFGITYFWQSQEKTSKDLIIYIDLVNEEGNPVLEDVHAPIYGIYPTSKWIRGEMLAENYNVRLPPTVEPGKYQVFLMGIWNQEIPGDYERILLGNIDVG